MPVRSVVPVSRKCPSALGGYQGPGTGRDKLVMGSLVSVGPWLCGSDVDQMANLPAFSFAFGVSLVKKVWGEGCSMGGALL